MQVKHPLADLLERHKKEPSCLAGLKEDMVVTNPPRSYEFAKMGCLILAGGQGTRLGWNGPKGCMPLPLPGRPTLLQQLLEKIKRKGKALPVAVMTSPLNRTATEKYLRKHRFFGLKQLALFEQGICFVSDCRGFIVYEAPDIPVTAPAGNGQALHHFYRSGIWQAWRDRGVEVVQVIFVDNLLNRPFDEELLGVYEAMHCDLVVRCVKREDPTEKIGVIGLQQGRLTVREYTELLPAMNRKQGARWDFPFGHTGIFSCTMAWIEKIQPLVLPWHLAWKKRGERSGAKVIKFEKFLFDLFPHAETFALLPSTRTAHFAPLKSKQDLDNANCGLSKSII
ncbi:MAG: UTP--glucose-1-phosphate uridylyltransferase [Chlamydiota bacterium]